MSEPLSRIQTETPAATEDEPTKIGRITLDMEIADAERARDDKKAELQLAEEALAGLLAKRREFFTQ